MRRGDERDVAARRDDGHSPWTSTKEEPVTAVLRIEPRWTDLDPVGHVNNSVFLVYAEEARARFLHAALPSTWSSIVVVHNAIDYHHPVEQSDHLEFSSAVDGIGKSSFTTINVVATATHRCATVRTVQ